MNCEGRIVVRVERCGAATALADIVRAVEAAQARAAPVQRLADRVAGGFAAGVLALSTATFAFWATAGPRLFPQACLSLSPERLGSPSAQVLCASREAGSRPDGALCRLHVHYMTEHCGACYLSALVKKSVTLTGCTCKQVIARHGARAGSQAAALLLAAQLACNVLVVACPCALGLAAPTAVLVGTSQGARRCAPAPGCILVHSAHEGPSNINTWHSTAVKLGLIKACMPLTARHPALWHCTLAHCLWKASHTGEWCRRGLLIRGGDILEAASKVDSIVFDKTGTLTVGRPEVTDIRPAPLLGVSQSDLLSLAAALERESTHPIASAINAAASSKGGRATSSSFIMCHNIAIFRIYLFKRSAFCVRLMS